MSSRRITFVLDPRKLAALLTPALLARSVDDAPEAKACKVGTCWLRWGDVHHRGRAHLN
jgi:hypothetical protein